ncbi:MAG: hypothetical protein RBR69_09430 [Candidatus Cloacimonadaceae bacterium]|jgi:tRNA nucleotidyltransferase/poly(A) polymerase|nr:hypothetical protein [Candidatus Cloacimonadota bacterium]MDY0128337.1 hypothetical protein [Candidatus Cloacimonadaceae bacterium]MCB5255478.1 hypothetical protein [Candidatus Cloacimonadota bacterium]MCK9178962.1 hypothetical protein [Candidatus Cloacimonadota bacterium]MCK9243191.1 hypothetical protein [Candidatus Cloacimonadota bacterium]
MKLEVFLKIMRRALQGSDFVGRTYLVGGVVRDLLLGKDDFTDFDLCVEKRYGGLKLGSYLKTRLNPQSYEVFPRFGTVRMKLKDIEIDLVQTRCESYTKGRRFPRIRYCPISEDVWRRDFTINSLYLELFSESILDPCGRGKTDLQDRLIRTTRDPVLVFSEDALRMLRALRFVSTLDFDLEAETYAAMRSLAANVQRLSAKAQCQELNKMNFESRRLKLLLKESGIQDYLK